MTFARGGGQVVSRGTPGSLYHYLKESEYVWGQNDSVFNVTVAKYERVLRVDDWNSSRYFRECSLKAF